MTYMRLERLCRISNVCVRVNSITSSFSQNQCSHGCVMSQILFNQFKDAVIHNMGVRLSDCGKVNYGREQRLPAFL